MRTLLQKDFFIITQNERWFSADATRPFYVSTNGMKIERRQFGSTQLWHAVLYSCRGWLQPIFITRPILRRYFSHFEKRRYFAIKAHTKKNWQKRLICQRSLCHQTKHNAKSNKQRVKKRLRCFKWGLTIVACGTAVVRDAFTAVVFITHSTPLRYNLASSEWNEMHDKRYHVRAANSWLKSRKLGVYVDVV